MPSDRSSFRLDGSPSGEALVPRDGYGACELHIAEGTGLVFEAGA
ncbi:MULTISPECIES: hypothetical protein [unclassified Nocardioides]|nr:MULTISPECIES: hypothetical protein [unclassified Nocardioides]